ncbi:hypothetical protein A0H81_11237 [Grifola frondosa]|uniref:Uncharacterized protein n=1 Tax=Grifola frondosa TaxID=5627 RepID=A0A1C7LXH6_GRIFR|nr:hypothetical protein A0H81_11237 [Grifola frondosa]
MGQLQRIIRARTVVTNLDVCRPEERCAILQTLVDMVCNLPPRHPHGWDVASNLGWVAALVRGRNFIDHKLWELSPEERQLHACLHTYFGFTEHDWDPSRKTESLVYVYTMRHYKQENDYGPFLMDGSGRVNWEHLQAIHHVISLHVIPEDWRNQAVTYTIYPLSMPYCQSTMPLGLDLDHELDWAGIGGMWQCSFCFCDHRDLLFFNNYNTSDTETLHPEIFEDPDFVEVFRSINVRFRVTSTQQDLHHPSRPILKFIRWHFESGEQGQFIWSSEGVQIGCVRSSFGVLGAWTTVSHDRPDPVGPFWLRKMEDDDVVVVAVVDT